MLSSDRDHMRAWIQATRPLAHVNIVVPLVLGHAAAWHATGAWSWWWLVMSLAWGALDHMFVIFANDYADREADSGRTTRISGGSGVLPEGKLRPGQVARAAIAAALGLAVLSVALAFAGRPWTPLYTLAALALLWLYSYPPVRLSYRGGGELLQGIGLGVGLPSLAYYLQTEAWFAPAWVMGPAALLGVCGNVLTALPDVDDDAQAKKRTWPVRHGVPSARRVASAGTAFAAFLIFLWTPDVPVPIKAAVSIAPMIPLLMGTRTTTVLGAAWSISVAQNSLLALWITVLLIPF